MKANIHKLGLYIVDANGIYKDIEDIINLIESHTDCQCKVAYSESIQNEWDDEL